MLTESITKNKSKLTINLDAIVDNWLFLKSKLSKNCICAPVVKANAYGLGAKMVAKVLSLSGCSVFLVATLEEGVRLRKDLAKDFRIVVMHDHFYENEDHFKLMGHFQDGEMVYFFNHEKMPCEILKIINFLR